VFLWVFLKFFLYDPNTIRQLFERRHWLTAAAAAGGGGCRSWAAELQLHYECRFQGIIEWNIVWTITESLSGQNLSFVNFLRKRIGASKQVLILRNRWDVDGRTLVSASNIVCKYSVMNIILECGCKSFLLVGNIICFFCRIKNIIFISDTMAFK
jgi:hypothetical protein